MTTVVNKHIDPFDVYIGRPTKWGNPFTHLDYGLGTTKVATREESIEAYEAYIRSKPGLVAAAKRELKGKVLGCWCKPLACHGDVLARIAEEP